MQTSEPQPVKSTWPLGTPSRYGPLAGMIYEQTRLEFRAHDGHPDAVETLLSAPNRAERLRLARAIGHAAHTLRETEGLANDVVNLVHEANRLIARRPVPPRRRKMDLTRVEAFLTRAGIGGDLPLSAFPADELPDPDLRLRLDFIGHNGDQAYPNVLCFRYDLFQNRDNLEPTTEEESTTPVQSPTAGSALQDPNESALIRSSPVATAAASKGPSSAGIGLPAIRVNVPAHLATLVTVLLMFAFPQSRPVENQLAPTSLPVSKTTLGHKGLFQNPGVTATGRPGDSGKARRRTLVTLPQGDAIASNQEAQRRQKCPDRPSRRVGIPPVAVRKVSTPIRTRQGVEIVSNTAVVSQHPPGATAPPPLRLLVTARGDFVASLRSPMHVRSVGEYEITCVDFKRGHLCESRRLQRQHAFLARPRWSVGVAVVAAAPPRGLLHHSDRGVQYARGDYQVKLVVHGLQCSMRRTGDCYDNVAMESFYCSRPIACCRWALAITCWNNARW